MINEMQRLYRKSGIGGSDAAAVCGLSRYKTPLDIYHDKTLDLPQVETEPMYWGNALEQLICKRYIELTGNELEYPVTQRKGVAIANMDGYVRSDNRVFEAKTARYGDGWGEDGSDEIPTEYLFQVAHYCYVIDADGADIAVLIGGNQFKIYHYTRTPELEKSIIEKENHFWYEHVEKLIPPSPTTNKEMSEFWTAQTGKKVDANEEIYGKIVELKSVKNQIKELSKKEDELESEIKLIMQDAEELVLCNQTLATWKPLISSRFDSTSFSKDNKELFERYKVMNQTRRFALAKTI